MKRRTVLGMAAATAIVPLDAGAHELALSDAFSGIEVAIQQEFNELFATQIEGDKTYQSQFGVEYDEGRITLHLTEFGFRMPTAIEAGLICKMFVSAAREWALREARQIGIWERISTYAQFERAHIRVPIVWRWRPRIYFSPILRSPVAGHSADAPRIYDGYGLKAYWRAHLLPEGKSTVTERRVTA